MTKDSGMISNRCLRGSIIIIMSICVTTTAGKKCTTIDIKSEHMNKVLTKHVMSAYTDLSNYRCALRCMGVHGCLSMSYCRQTQHCVMHSVDSSSVKFEHFLAVTGFVYSDLVGWNMKNVCGIKACAVGDTCFPTGSRHVCKSTGQTEVPPCSPNATSLNCYVVYEHKDMYGYPVTKPVPLTNVVDCMLYCNTNAPTYKTLLFNAKHNLCFCKSISVWSYLADGKQLNYYKGAFLYQRIQ